MPRELVKVTDKRHADGGVYRFEDVVVCRSFAFIDAYAMQADGSVTAVVRMSEYMIVRDESTETEIRDGDVVSLAEKQLWVVSSARTSTAVNDHHLAIEFRDHAGRATWKVEATLTAVSLLFQADFDRDGKIDAEAPADVDWKWGRGGTGAVLLVNSDRDTAHPNPHSRDRHDRRVNGPLDLADMTSALVRLDAPADFDIGRYSVRVRVSDAAASRVRVFDTSTAVPRAVIGPGIPATSWPAARGTRELRLEGLDYPDAGFTGLVTTFCDLVKDDESYGTDTLVLRVAPWLALPNTQRARRLFIAEMKDGSNRSAIDGIREFARAADVELTVVPPTINRDDRWLQDEIEIGYAQTPTKVIPVVLDSPRDRGLDDFPETSLLGPDFGYVTRGDGSTRGSLDSFGNLDCTPPHTGGGVVYPFGRILFGGAQPGAQNGRRMMKAVSDFMYAQVVQPPIELFSDWLNVGHVDEFMSFVPAPDRKKFRLVLASPDAAYAVLERLNAAGNGGLLLMPGKRHEVTVAALLDGAKLRAQNEKFQRYIDWNKGVLMKEMALLPEDVVYLPALYYARGTRADAFFPGMVNMQVANGHLAIPKPFGPVVDGRCAFESAAETAFGALGLTCHFIGTYEGYHLNLGEIHCGTNVVRDPFERGWWEFEPTSEKRR